jgi:hypothetical protein
MGRRFRRIATLTWACILSLSSILFAQSASLDSRREAPNRSKSIREPTDWEIATIVRAAFWQDKDLAPLNLQVSVEKGVATVEGPVPSGYLRRKAIALVESLRGIRGVRDQVRVRAAPTSGQSGARFFPPVDQPWPKQGTPIPPPETPLKAPVVAEPTRSEPLMNQPGSEEKPAPMPAADWQPSSGQGIWSPSTSVRAGLLPPLKGQEEKPKVSLGTPVARPKADH